VGVTDWLPLVGSLPLQALLAVQDVTLAEDQVSKLLWPSVMLLGLATMLTMGAPTALTLTVAAAETLPVALVQVRV
jgi:hypothetical protein